MVCLLEALTEPPADDMVAVRTAAATLEELCLFEMSANRGSDDSNGNGETNRDESNSEDSGSPGLGDGHGAVVMPSGNLRALDARHRWFTVMLTDAYARSAGKLGRVKDGSEGEGLIAARSMASWCETVVRVYMPRLKAEGKRGGVWGSDEGNCSYCEFCSVAERSLNKATAVYFVSCVRF